MTSTLEEGIINVKDLIGDAVSNITNPFASSPAAAAIGGAVVGAGTGALVTASLSKSGIRRKKRKTKSKVSRKRHYKSKRRRRKQRQPHTAGKRKDTSHRRIRYTKNNQPYVIMGNGRARFISKSSARRSRKLKGGRY